MINVGLSLKKRHVCEKSYIWNPAQCTCDNGKYLVSIMESIQESIMYDSAITCDQIIEEDKKTFPTNFNEKSRL